MKNNVLFSLLCLSLLTVSCVKSSDTKVDIPKFKKMEPISVKKKGLRCELLGSEESKDIFLEITKDEKTKINIYDFQDENRISITGAVIEGFQTISFTMNPFEVLEGGNWDGSPLPVMIGDSSVIKTKDAIIVLEGEAENPDRKVITSTATLSLDAENNGIMYFTHTIKSESGISQMSGLNSAQIENCQAFEATYL